MTSNLIKFIAIIAMIFDHCIYSLTYGLELIDPDFFLYPLLGFPGKIVAPIMCYFVAESYHYTSNKKKYISRLLLLAIVSHIPYILLFEGTWWKTTSIIWGFLLGFIALHIAKDKDLNKFAKALVVSLCCLLSLISTYDSLVVLWILFFGLYRNDTKKQIFSFCIITFCGGLSSILVKFIMFGFSSWYTFGMLLAIPLILLYNGERGKKSKFSKYGFYLVFPLHHLVLFVLFFI